MKKLLLATAIGICGAALIAHAAILPSSIDFGSGGGGGQNALTLQTAIGSAPKTCVATNCSSYITPLTATSFTFAAVVSGTPTVSEVFIDPAGTIAAFTINLPACAAANDGDERTFTTSRIITTLTITPAAGTLSNGAATAGAVGVGHGYHCVGSATLWFQMY